MLKVWGRRSSFNVQKVLWLVGELGLAHEHIPAGGSFGRLDEPAFRALNPHGRVPVIEDGDVTVWDSHLTHGSYLCAVEPTIADLSCYGDVAFAEICAFDVNRWTNVAGWAARVMALAGFKAPFELLAMEDAELS